MGTLKADCTPEQWAAYLVKARARRLKRTPAERALVAEYQREYRKQPAVRTKGREASLAWMRANRRRFNEVQKQRRTGMSPALYQALMVLQDGACALCRKPFTRLPNRDHCHDTKQPRGLLCHHCNVAEGIIKKIGLTPEDFGKRLADYLANPPAKIAVQT